MKTWLLPLSLLVASCGPLVDLNGYWEGTWSGTANGQVQSGALEIAVDTGVVHGTCTNVALDESCTISGTVDPSGNVTLTYTYPRAGTYTSTCTTKTQLAANNDEHGYGSCNLYVGGTLLGTSMFDLVRLTSHVSTPPR